MAIQIKDNFKTMGGITTSGAISTSGNGSHSIGSTANRFNSIIGANVYAYDANAQHMASLRTTTTGTTDTVGVGRLIAGNNVESGTAGNAKGQVLLYGTNTGYTTITPGNNSTSNVTLTLPSATGSIPLMSKGDTSYWGLTPPDGGSGWIRTTSSGIIPSANGSGALGTSSWQFSSIYGQTIYENGTALSGKYAPLSHDHGRIVTRGNVTCESGITARPEASGLSMTQVYNNGYPTTYGNVISLRGQGDGQLLIGWSGTDGAHAPMYVRNKRDNTTTADWSPWAKVYTEAFKPTASEVGALPISGGTMTGAIGFKSGAMSGSWVGAANGSSMLNSQRDAGSFHPIYTAATTNGKMVTAIYQNALQVSYLTKANCDAGNNTVSVSTYLYENGDAKLNGALYLNTNNKTLYGKYTDGSDQAMLRMTNANVVDVGNANGTTCILSKAHPTHYDGSKTYELHSDRNHSWGLFRTNGGQDFIGRDKRCMVATTTELVINYGPDFTQTHFHGNIHVDGYAKINGTPVSVQSSAPSVGGVWIQI